MQKELLEVCVALNIALTDILEASGSPYRDMTRPPASDGDYLISRYDRARALLAIRKAERLFNKIEGKE